MFKRMPIIEIPLGIFFLVVAAISFVHGKAYIYSCTEWFDKQTQPLYFYAVLAVYILASLMCFGVFESKKK